MARFGAEWIYISELETLGQVKIGNQENFWIADASDAEWIYTYPQSWKLWVKSRWREVGQITRSGLFQAQNWKPRNKVGVGRTNKFDSTWSIWVSWTWVFLTWVLLVLSFFNLSFLDFSNCGWRPVGDWERSRRETTRPPLIEITLPSSTCTLYNAMQYHTTPNHAIPFNTIPNHSIQLCDSSLCSGEKPWRRKRLL